MINPVFLIASAINADGRIELPAVQDGTHAALVRALFEPDEGGGFVQWVVPSAGGGAARGGRPQPLDMTFFARCLSGRFGGLTPALFAIRGYAETGGLRGRLLHADAASETARRQVLRNAFLVHLAAYEERLV